MRGVVDFVERALDVLIRERARLVEGRIGLRQDLRDRHPVERAGGVVVDPAGQVALLAVAGHVERRGEVLQGQLTARREAVLAVGRAVLVIGPVLLHLVDVGEEDAIGLDAAQRVEEGVRLLLVLVGGVEVVADGAGLAGLAVELLDHRDGSGRLLFLRVDEGQVRCGLRRRPGRAVIRIVDDVALRVVGIGDIDVRRVGLGDRVLRPERQAVKAEPPVGVAARRLLEAIRPRDGECGTFERLRRLPVIRLQD